MDPIFTPTKPLGGLERGGRRQLATSSSGRKVDTDSPRPPSIIIAGPLRTRLLLNDLADVDLVSRRALGERRILHWRGPRPGPSDSLNFLQTRRKGGITLVPFRHLGPAL